MDKVIEDTSGTSFTIARWINDSTSGPWLWVSHNPHEQFKTQQEAQRVAENEKAIPGFFVVRIEKQQTVIRCGDSNA
jgi:hypothetical protein